MEPEASTTQKIPTQQDDAHEFVYNQLFELMKLESSRRDGLDSKAYTYIAFVSITVTLLVAMGSLMFEYFKKFRLIVSDNVKIMLILYLLTEIFFFAGILFAFKAYHTGSIKIPKFFSRFHDLSNEYLFNWNLVPGTDERRLKEIIARDYNAKWIKKSHLNKTNDSITASDCLGNSLNIKMNYSTREATLSLSDGTLKTLMVKEEDSQLKLYCLKKEVFLKVNAEEIAMNAHTTKKFLYKMLILQLHEICHVNSKLNFEKSNNILRAYKCTLLALTFLLLLNFFIVGQYLI